MNKITEISEENDLQMASSALDASTTIYSKRIDILHEQTNSLLSRIAMGGIFFTSHKFLFVAFLSLKSAMLARVITQPLVFLFLFL